MLSRVAEAIFWLNRYIERAENVARFISVNLNLMLDLPEGPGGSGGEPPIHRGGRGPLAGGGPPDRTEEQWEPLLLTTADLPKFSEHYDAPTRKSVMEFLTFDPDNPNSIMCCLHAARENARSVRETIPSEVWEHVNRFYLMVSSASFQGFIADPHSFYTRIKTESHLFAGLTDATMSRGEGWHFGRMGRMLERADKTSRILDVKYFMLLPAPTEVGTPFDQLQWAALLRSTSALEAYRKKCGRVTPEKVADYLILDREFPRSILFCLTHVEESLRAVSGSRPGTFQNAAEQRLGRLRSSLIYARIQEIMSQGLHEFLDALQVQMNKVGDSISESFFSMRTVDELRSRLETAAHRASE